MPDRHLGQSLGRFRLDSLIGSGGFAWVYRGYDPDLDIPVAVKVLKPQYAGEPSFEERFRGEATTAARLRHPNIVRILAVGRERDAAYFAMDFLPGSLDEKLRMLGTLPEPVLLRLALDVSNALAFAHREGVIHRDIKTDNVLYDAHGNAVVVDFGIARAAADDGTRTGTNMVVGTPQYFAPEQARGLPIDGRADLYALGVTLFRAATGTLPFLGGDWYEVARQHVEDPPPKPRSLSPALSPEVEYVILRCLEKRPEDRYQSAEQLHDALQELSGASPPGASTTLELPALPEGSRHRPPRPVALRRPLWITTALVIVAAVSAAVVYARSGTRGARPAAGDSARAAPPAAPALPDGATLHIIAPAAATVLLDGSPAGRGELQRAVRPGPHRVTATLAGAGNCRWARADTIATAGASGTLDLRLVPRRCGSLDPDIQPPGARWTLLAPDGASVASSRAADSGPVTVPEGTWTLRVSAPFCAEYRAPVRVDAGHPARVRIRLMCGAGH